jgi:hypothetical protein
MSIRIRSTCLIVKTWQKWRLKVKYLPLIPNFASAYLISSKTLPDSSLPPLKIEDAVVFVAAV